MFEFEVNYLSLQEKDIPSDVRKSFRSALYNTPEIEYESLLLWGEHCTECAMPECYSSCELYAPRKDGKCRRFVNGISKVKDNNLPIGYFIRVEFKRWGALMATNELRVYRIGTVQRVEKLCRLVENVARNTPDAWLSILGRRGISSRLAKRFKDKAVQRVKFSSARILPSHFLLEMYNPDNHIVDITLVIRAVAGERNNMPYQRRMKLGTGYHRELIPFTDISTHVDIEQEHFVSIIPNEHEDLTEATTLYISRIGFFKFSGTHRNTTNQEDLKKTKPIKIVVWDLDKTVWNGILAESNSDQMTLRPEVREVILELDRRGIVNSIISKNDYDTAMHQLEKLGLADYFVFPQISWEPKSISMKKLVSDFNVAADTISFIDDSPFEREEVISQLPDIRTFDEMQYVSFLSRPEFSSDTSSESSQRRQFYKNQKVRKEAAVNYKSDYFSFIKSCQMELDIQNGNIVDLERIHELVQRTNQLNFSGNRYNKNNLTELLTSTTHDTYTLKCKDKFGDYGTVGFCIIERQQPLMMDLMLSCRIQSKKVEHTFLVWLMEHYKSLGFTSFFVIYNRTEKNTPAGCVFKDLGFESVETKDNRELYCYDLEKRLPEEDLITVQFTGEY